MKTTKNITVPEVKMHVKTVDITVCDFCKKERKVTKCKICDRDICTYGYYPEHCAKADPTDDGDYPDKYCPICFKLRFETYREEINQIEEEAFNKEDNVISKIKEESLKSIISA